MKKHVALLLITMFNIFNVYSGDAGKHAMKLEQLTISPEMDREFTQNMINFLRQQAIKNAPVYETLSIIDSNAIEITKFGLIYLLEYMTQKMEKDSNYTPKNVKNLIKFIQCDTKNYQGRCSAIVLCNLFNNTHIPEIKDTGELSPMHYRLGLIEIFIRHKVKLPDGKSYISNPLYRRLQASNNQDFRELMVTFNQLDDQRKVA